jgi:hypothetical protein
MAPENQKPPVGLMTIEPPIRRTWDRRPQTRLGPARLKRWCCGSLRLQAHFQLLGEV